MSMHELHLLVIRFNKLPESPEKDKIGKVIEFKMGSVEKVEKPNFTFS